MDAPPLPPGFVLDQAASASPPPLPPGFVLDGKPPPTADGAEVPLGPEDHPFTVGGRDRSGQSGRGSGSAPSRTESFGRGINQGMTFNFGDELSGVQDASGLPAPPAWLGPAGTLYNASRTGAGAARMAAEYVAPDTFGHSATDQYGKTVDAERAANDAAQQANPGTYAIGQLAGALPTAFVAPELGAAKALTPFARAAMTGAGYGALSGAGEGTDLESRAMGAGSGAVLGGTVGGVASGAVSAVTPAAKYLGKATGLIAGDQSAVDAEAARRIQAALDRDASMGSDGLPTQAMGAAQQAGLPVINADRGGETVKALAKSAANTSPEARGVLKDAINPRYANQAERVSGAVKSVAGTQGDAGATVDALQAQARAANRPAYAKAYWQGANGVWDGDLHALTQAPDVQAAIRKATKTGANRATVDGFPAVKNPFVEKDGKLFLEQKADGSVAYPSLQFWDHVQRNLRDMAEASARTGKNSAASDTKALRTALNAKLDTHAPAFQEARQGAARFFGAEDAVEAGEKFVSGNQPIAEARRAFSKMNDAEKAMFKEGFVSELVNKIQRTGDTRDVVNAIFASPNARDKIRLALGDDGARKLEAHLRVENIMTRLRTAINEGSPTIRYLAEMGMAGGIGGTAQGLLTGEMDPRKLSLGFLIGAAAKRGVIKIDSNVARRVGEMLASDDPQIIDRGLRAAASNPAIMKGLQWIEGRLPAAGGSIVGARGGSALRAISSQVPSRADDNKSPQVPPVRQH